MGVPVLRITDGNGNIIPIPAIKGEGNVPEITNYTNQYGTQSVYRYDDGTQLIVGKTTVGVSSYTMVENFSSDFSLEMTVAFPRYGNFEKPFISITENYCRYGGDMVKNGISCKINEITNSGIANFTAINLSNSIISDMVGYVHYVILGRWK